MPAWLIGIGAAFAGMNLRRLLISGAVMVLGLSATWLWHRASYVPRADYRALERKYEAQGAVLAEREKAAEADAAQAEADAVRLRELEELADAHEAHGHDPVVWDGADIERLRRLRR